MKIISCFLLFFAVLFGQWPPAVNLGIPGYDDINPQSCRIQSQRICLVWQTMVNGNWDIFSRYVISNTAWSDTLRVTSSAYPDHNPAVAYDPNRNCFWCVWQSDSAGFEDIMVSQGSTSGGWSAPFKLTSDTFPDGSPSVCVVGSNVWVAWQRDTAGRAINIYSEYYNGSSWSSPTRVTDAADSDNTNPKINLRVDHPFLAWERNRDIYYSEYLTGSWTSPQAVTTNAASDSLPEIAVSPSGYPTGAWIYWQSNRDGNWEIYRTGLDTFNVNHRVTNNSSEDVSPCPINGQVPIRFSEALLLASCSNRSGNYDIFNKFFWNDSFYRVDTNQARDINPMTAADFHVFVWVLWQTDRNVDWDICGSFYLAGGAVEESKGAVAEVMDISPNPFRDRILFSKGQSAKSIEFKIYDISGRLVKSFALGPMPSALCWSGTDRSGRDVSPGIYFAVLKTDQGVIIKKMVRIR